jgi:hypothetical protein
MTWDRFLSLSQVERYYQNEALNERIENFNKTDSGVPGPRPKDWR